MAHLVLGEAIEEVGLVFTGVGAGEEMKETVRAAFDAGVVAGGEEVIAHGEGFVEEQAEFEELIAADTGVGRAALEIFLTKILDYELFESIAEAEDEVRDAEVEGDVPGIGDALRAAATGAGRGEMRDIEAHGDAGDGMALLREERGSDG